MLADPNTTWMSTDISGEACCIFRAMVYRRVYLRIMLLRALMHHACMQIQSSRHVAKSATKSKITSWHGTPFSFGQSADLFGFGLRHIHHR